MQSHFYSDKLTLSAKAVAELSAFLSLRYGNEDNGRLACAICNEIATVVRPANNANTSIAFRSCIGFHLRLRRSNAFILQGEHVSQMPRTAAIAMISKRHRRIYFIVHFEKPCQ